MFGCDVATYCHIAFFIVMAVLVMLHFLNRKDQLSVLNEA